MHSTPTNPVAPTSFDTTDCTHIRSIEYDPETDLLDIRIVTTLASVRTGDDLEVELSAKILDVDNAIQQSRGNL